MHYQEWSLREKLQVLVQKLHEKTTNFRIKKKICLPSFIPWATYIYLGALCLHVINFQGFSVSVKNCFGQVLQEQVSEQEGSNNLTRFVSFGLTSYFEPDV